MGLTAYRASDPPDLFWRAHFGADMVTHQPSLSSKATQIHAGLPHFDRFRASQALKQRSKMGRVWAELGPSSVCHWQESILDAAASSISDAGALTCTSVLQHNADHSNEPDQR